MSNPLAGAGGRRRVKRQQHRRSRKIERLVASLFAVGFGAVLIFYFQDYTINGLLPAPWLGYLVTGVGTAGLLGINVFWGGPLDKRRDP